MPVFVPKYTKFTTPFSEIAKTTLIYGPSNLGKTHWACAHFKNPLVVSHVDKLKQLSPDHDGIVFDDMSFSHWPPSSVIHLVDTELERDINIRYGTVNIPANTKKIFTYNSDNPFYDCDKISEEQRSAIERRISRIHVMNHLYNHQNGDSIVQDFQ